MIRISPYKNYISNIRKTNNKISFKQTSNVDKPIQGSTVSVNIAKEMNKHAAKDLRASELDHFSVNFAEDKMQFAGGKTYRYISPETSKSYHLIDLGRDNSGKVKLRILDSEGKFTKEAVISPKKVILPDDYSYKYIYNAGLTHGEMVSKVLSMNSPCLDIEPIDVGSIEPMNVDKDKVIQAFQNILKRVKSGEKINLVSCSFNHEFSYEFYEILSGKDISELSSIQKTSHIKDFCNTLNKVGYKEYCIANNINYKNINIVKAFKALEHEIKVGQLIEELNKQGVRVIQGAGNGGVSHFDPLFAICNIEGVASLSPMGELSGFSSSRVNNWVKHYELGEYVMIESSGFNPGRVNKLNFIKNNEDAINFLNKRRFKKRFINGEKFVKLLMQGKNPIEEFPEGIFNIRDYKMILEMKTYGYEKGLYVYKHKVFNKLGDLVCDLKLSGTSFSTPVRAAKILLHDSLKHLNL